MMKKTTLLILIGLLCTLCTYAQWEQKSNLPAIYIVTFDGYGIYSKTEYKYCKLHYVDEEGHVTSYDSVLIRGRGNSTWSLAKKPYRIKFNNKVKFLGTGYAKTKKWTLLANAGDKTMMRNALTSAMGDFTSLKFNPAAKFVDMVLNGTYVGTYQISDQVDVRPHRVNVTEQPVPPAATDDITGGYLLEVDGFREGNCFSTSRYGAPVRIHYPDDEDIVSAQTNYIRNYVNEFDLALYSTDFDNPTTGYRAYVDSASLVDWYICTEVSANIDGFYSTYFYKEQADPKLYWGPLWDYDIAYNNDYRVRNEQGLTTTAYSLMADIAYSGSKAWVNRMWEDPWFQKLVYNRYKELLDKGLVDYLHHKIDSFANVLNRSQKLNYEKWGINTRAYHEFVLYSSYDQYVADLKQFVTDHCAYLEQAFANRKPVEPTPAFVPDNYYYHLINAKTSKAIATSGAGVYQLSENKNDESEDWEIRKVGTHFQLINRQTEEALNDPTEGAVGPSTNVGTQLNTATPDDTDERQLWNIIPQGTAGYYNLENVYSQHIANLQGGSNADYTSILSYASDSRNGESQNRLWYIVSNGELPATPTSIREVEPEEYALAYNPQTQVLHFGSETPEALTFNVSVMAINGIQVGTFRANEEFSMSALPSGVYVVTWTAGGQTRSIKFRK